MWNDISVLFFSPFSVHSTFQSCHSNNLLLSVIKELHIIELNRWFFVFIWLQCNSIQNSVWNSVFSIILTAHIFLLPWQLIFSLLSYCLLLFLKTLFQPSIMFYHFFLSDISFSMTLNTNFMIMLTNDIVFTSVQLTSARYFYFFFIYLFKIYWDNVG